MNLSRKQKQTHRLVVASGEGKLEGWMGSLRFVGASYYI